MQGVGAAFLILSYAVGYAAWQQLSGTGGSVLYWMTGNKRFGQPVPKSNSSSSSSSSSGTPAGGAGNAPTTKNPGTPVPAPRR